VKKEKKSLAVLKWSVGLCVCFMWKVPCISSQLALGKIPGNKVPASLFLGTPKSQDKVQRIALLHFPPLTSSHVMFWPHFDGFSGGSRAKNIVPHPLFFFFTFHLQHMSYMCLKENETFLFIILDQPNAKV